MSGQVTEDSTVQIRVPVATTTEFDAIKKKGIVGWDETRGVFVVCPADDADFVPIGGGGVGIVGAAPDSEVHNSVVPGLAGGTAAFSANGATAAGPQSFAANGGIAYADRSASLNSGNAQGARSLAANLGVAVGPFSFASGNSQADGVASSSGGGYTLASGDFSSVRGIGGDSRYAADVCGLWPIIETSSPTEREAGQSLFKVGNGTDDTHRGDAFRVNEDGTGYLAKRLSLGIWDGYAEGPVDFTGGLSGGGNIPTNGTNILGNAPVLKGSRTIPNDIANMALGDVINVEWLGRIVHTSGGALYFRDLNSVSYTQIMYINTLASGTYYAKVTGKYIVAKIVADVPQIKLEWRIELRSGDGYANPMIIAINDMYATQDTGGGAFYPIAAPLTFAFGINAANATRPKQISFRMWRE